MRSFGLQTIGSGASGNLRDTGQPHHALAMGDGLIRIRALQTSPPAPLRAMLPNERRAARVARCRWAAGTATPVSMWVPE
ncbi:hypothetical protein XFF6992_280003 [Xanthomonas citri pv. fuscans]|nr:hypothetical protein XFF6992_280003 [Xanthomonas citri pv. fuscans]SOO32920.1 hypothetical protein XFF6994_2470003 [Xanthomonas citri pv. fuscans]